MSWWWWWWWWPGWCSPPLPGSWSARGRLRWTAGSSWPASQYYWSSSMNRWDGLNIRNGNLQWTCRSFTIWTDCWSKLKIHSHWAMIHWIWDMCQFSENFLDKPWTRNDTEVMAPRASHPSFFKVNPQEKCQCRASSWVMGGSQVCSVKA